MSTIEQIESVLQQYKDILSSFRTVFGRTVIETGRIEDAPEHGFDKKQMASIDSNLFAMVGRLFVGKPLSQALQQIDFWRSMYIEVQETDNPFSFEGTPEHEEWKALGLTFLNNASTVAERWCVKDEATPRVGGVDHPKQVQQNKTQIEIQILHLPDDVKALLESATCKGLVEADGCKYRWKDTASLYGYFVDKTSDFLNLRYGNGRVPWKKYEEFISNHKELLATAKQAVNDYKNKDLNPPEGDDKVNDICK